MASTGFWYHPRSESILNRLRSRVAAQLARERTTQVAAEEVGIQYEGEFLMCERGRSQRRGCDTEARAGAAVEMSAVEAGESVLFRALELCFFVVASLLCVTEVQVYYIQQLQTRPVADKATRFEIFVLSFLLLLSSSTLKVVRSGLVPFDPPVVLDAALFRRTTAGLHSAAHRKPSRLLRASIDRGWLQPGRTRFYSEHCHHLS